MSTGLHRQAREYCEETCPAVDIAFSNALAKLEDFISSEDRTHVASILDYLRDTVKRVGTEKLRDALCSAIRDKNDLEEERDELQDRVRCLESDVDDLEHQVSELERELSEVTA